MFITGSCETHECRHPAVANSWKGKTNAKLRRKISYSLGCSRDTTTITMHPGSYRKSTIVGEVNVKQTKHGDEIEDGCLALHDNKLTVDS